MSSGFLSGLFRRSGTQNKRAETSSGGETAEVVKSASADERLISLRCAEAREEERRRMAVDLHDGPIQQLVNLVLRLDMAEKALPPDATETRAELAALRQFAKNILQDMRRFMFELRPASLDEFALLPVLRQYVQDFRTQYNIPVELKISDTSWSLERTMEINLFRIIQEALTNVRKHANASRVEVVLERKDSTVVVRVTDNGRGFDVVTTRARAQAEKKLGLASMADRARALNGDLFIESREGSTTVSVIVPVPAEEATSHHG